MAREIFRPRRVAPAAKPGERGDVAESVGAFLARAHAVPAPAAGTGRLIFALDATMSRQPSWDLACQLQSEMFDAAGAAGRLEVQLVYFRGHGEARASSWLSSTGALKRAMTGLGCRGGLTQIGKVLAHAEREASKRPIAALVYVGDTMEEDIDRVCDQAGRLGLRGTRAFMFLEGRDPVAERAYREIARLTGGVLLPFDPRAADELRGLLGAIGAFAAGGRAALEARGGAPARRLLSDLRP
jgi:hypothetical protein